MTCSIASSPTSQRPVAPALVKLSATESGFDGLFGPMLDPAADEVGNPAAEPGKTLPVSAPGAEPDILGDAMPLLNDTAAASPKDASATGDAPPARLRGVGDKRPVLVVRDSDPGAVPAETPPSDDHEESPATGRPRDPSSDPAIAAIATLPPTLPRSLEGEAPVLARPPERRIEAAPASPATVAQQPASPAPSPAILVPPASAPGVTDAVPVGAIASNPATSATMPATASGIRARQPEPQPELASIPGPQIVAAIPTAVAAQPGPRPATLDTAALLGRRAPVRVGTVPIAGEEPMPLVGGALTTGAALAASAAVAAPPVDLTRATWPTAMIDRIEHLRDAADAVSTSIRVIPNALGAIDVSVRKEGEVTHVHLAADNAQTRALLADASPKLVEIAEQRGLKLGRADIGSGSGNSGGERQQPAAEHRAPPRPAPRTQRSRAPEDHRVA